MISGDNGLGAWHRLVKIMSAFATWMVQGRGMPERRINGALARVALLLAALALAGCSTSIADIPLGGASSDARSNDPGAYLPVNELPPARDEAAMDPAERVKLQKELVAARERQASVPVAKDQGQSKDQGPNQSQPTK
jgi:hypothetical protein